MTTVVVNTHEAKSRLSELIRLAEAGQEVILARNGTVVAKLIPWPAPKTARRPGAWRGLARYEHHDLIDTDADVQRAFDESVESRP
jgi:prevent-host-death family protein